MSVPFLLAAALVLLSVPVLCACGYLFALTLLSRRLPLPQGGAPTTRFDVLVPAHDEAAGIARTVQNLQALDYPADLFRVRVIADNCTDDTAACARAAGAQVLERRDAQRRGKGYALAHAFERSLADGFADAVVVVDADTLASPNLLRAFDARVRAGAQAAQAEYGVANPDESWRTRLMTVAFALFHQVRSRGRERLGLSCGLRGNGMCFTTSLLRAQPHRAFSMVEDVEYGLQLGRAGIRVHFAHEARALGEMVSDEQASRSQRQRWEHGRKLLVREVAPVVFAEGVRQRSPLLVDLALDLLVPPLAQLGGVVLLGGLLSTVMALAGQPWTLVPWLACGLMLTFYVARGWQLSGVGLGGLTALARAPGYLLWKLAVAARGGPRRDEWVRTARKGEVAR